MSSAICFNLDQSGSSLSGNGLTTQKQEQMEKYDGPSTRLRVI